jgi:hypothetical protein
MSGVIFKLMRIRIRFPIQLITLMRIRIRILIFYLMRIWVRFRIFILCRYGSRLPKCWGSMRIRMRIWTHNTGVSNPKLVLKNHGGGGRSNVLPQPNPVQDPNPVSQINGEIRNLIRIRLLKFLSSYSGLWIRIFEKFSNGWHIYSFLSIFLLPYPFPEQVHKKSQINRD